MVNTIIRFKVDGVMRKGLKVGKWLAIVPHPYSHPTQRLIYNLISKQPIGDTVLLQDQAIDLAKNYEKIYSEFLPLWQEYPDIVIHEVARYSIPNGLKMCEYFKERL